MTSYWIFFQTHFLNYLYFKPWYTLLRLHYPH